MAIIEYVDAVGLFIMWKKGFFHEHKWWDEKLYLEFIL